MSTASLTNQPDFSNVNPRIYCWKSENEEIVFFQKQFFAKLFLCTRRMRFWWTSRFFSPKAGESSTQSQKMMEKILWIRKKTLSLINHFWSRRRQLVNPAKNRKPIIRKVFAGSPKLKKLMKTSKIMFPTGYCGHLGFSFDKPTKKFSAVNPYLLSLEVRECEAQIPNRSPFQNFFYGTRKT